MILFDVLSSMKIDFLLHNVLESVMIVRRLPEVKHLKKWKNSFRFFVDFHRDLLFCLFVLTFFSSSRLDYRRTSVSFISISNGSIDELRLDDFDQSDRFFRFRFFLFRNSIFDEIHLKKRFFVKKKAKKLFLKKKFRKVFRKHFVTVGRH